MSSYGDFKSECAKEISAMGANQELKMKSLDWLVASSKLKYSYHFEWLGRPIIQYPQDIVALQEIIWSTKPDLIIETGIAHGGSLILNASMLALLDLMDVESGKVIERPRTVLGIDIDIRDHNREAIHAHPLANRIEMLEGSSTSEVIVDKVKNFAENYSRVMVILDSNHTHEHVLTELDIYSQLVTAGQYLIVFDTVIEYFPDGSFLDRDWGKGNNPLTAVQKFISENKNFYVDTQLEHKLLVTVAPSGFLVRK